MIESNCTQKAHNFEFETMEGYTEKMIAWQVCVKNIMKGRCFGTERQPQSGHIFVLISASSQDSVQSVFRRVDGLAAYSSSSTIILANQACTSEVLLQTLVVMLQNGNHKSLVRALIDILSQKSYILKSTVEKLGFKYEGEEEFVHLDSGYNWGWGGGIGILLGADVAGKLLTGTMF
ncbi:hypothetical protein TNIN_108941 [Trichonephila inaurata madagascariensis]|uniref:Uncharacterized protein n=1 Tax=Trichonephila inaurata madagascariensis TaxID=2747483 RepID=A0A8X7CJG7_9ARAC|nr:hypothetical protein TNIN_108941 [Trichonephila inaurata madagascariensis]